MEFKKKHFDAVIVVEGKDDTKRLKQFFPGIETIETNGSAVSEEVLTEIEQLSKKRKIIVFTDPDFNGERIRKIVSRRVPTAEQAFITRDEGRPMRKKDSLGVEHASKAALIRALDGLHETSAEPESLSKADYQALGLASGPNARQKRERVGIALRIGYGNAKQFYKRLNLFGFTAEQVKKILEADH